MKQTKLRESVERYAYRVIWSEEDQEFVGLCAEMPSLSWLAPTQAAALAGIVNLAGKVVADLRKAADPIPEPLALRSYSVSSGFVSRRSCTAGSRWKRPMRRSP